VDIAVIGGSMVLGPYGWLWLDGVASTINKRGGEIKKVWHIDTRGVAQSVSAWAKANKIGEVIVRPKSTGLRGKIVAMEEILGAIRGAVVAFAGGDGTDKMAGVARNWPRQRFIDLRMVQPAGLLRAGEVRQREANGWRSKDVSIDIVLAADLQKPPPPGSVVIGAAGVPLLPCGQALTVESVVGLVRQYTRDYPAMRSAIEGAGLGGVVVCPCGGRRCWAPVVGVAMAVSAARRELRHQPSPEEMRASTVWWAKAAMAHARVALDAAAFSHPAGVEAGQEEERPRGHRGAGADRSAGDGGRRGSVRASAQVGAGAR